MPRAFPLAIFTVVALVAGAPALAAEAKLEMLDQSVYVPLEPQSRGENYKLTAENLHKRSMWGWRLVLPDGQGLGFGGLATWSIQERNGELLRTDDPLVRTQVMRAGKWVFIDEQLRKRNPLQSHHDRLAALRYDLKYIFGLARHVYLEGMDAAAERQFFEKRIAARQMELLAKLKGARAELAEAQSGDDAYLSGQVKLALSRLDAASATIAAFGPRATHENIAALRQARIALERAAEAIDAEPPARVLSMPTYDAKTGLFVIFGGEHFDYLMNDLWVFDPKAQRWLQRHPKTPAPEPRADHTLASDASGKITMRGGFIYARRNPLPAGWNRYANFYVHAGPGDWVYDLATDRWQGPKDAESAQADTRGYREAVHGENYSPDYFTAGEKPNAAEHEKVLAQLPANTWVDLKPPLKFAGNRDWGTLAYDAKRDTIYFYNGGHSAYCGTDVAHYHLATNRWDQPVEVEFPLNLIAASGRSVPGWTFNRRPWVTNHLWNSYGFHPGLDRLLVAGRLTSSTFPRAMGQPDENIYLYNPDLADWEKRVPSNVPMSCMGAQILHVPGFGMLEWNRWLLDEKSMAWKKLEPKGKLPDARIDHCGFVHDPTRNRVLFFSGGNYGDSNPYRGESWAMPLDTLETTAFVPEGSEHIGALTKQANPKGDLCLREIVYHPATDMFVFNSNLPGDYTLALDAKANRWVGLKLPGAGGKNRSFGLSTAWAYDAKRDLIYAVGTRADVFAVRLDPKTLVVRPLAEIVEELKKSPPPVSKK